MNLCVDIGRPDSAHCHFTDHEAMTERRTFVKLCSLLAGAMAARPNLLASHKVTLRHFERVRLVGSEGQPIKPSDVQVGQNYVFHYPYVTTPSFLLNVGERVRGGQMLQTENGRRYRWQGGVGPEGSIVGFSAICAHKMTHPSPSVSFINYRHESVRFKTGEKEFSRQSHVIYCCSEKSVYDATRGAEVLGGPAPQPLAAVLLEYDASEDALYASGCYGGDMFDQFFETFSERLQLEYLTTDVRRQASGTTVVEALSEFSKTQVLC